MHIVEAGLLHLEEHLQDGDDHGEREKGEHRRKYIEEYTQRQIAFIRRYEAAENADEFIHKRSMRKSWRKSAAGIHGLHECQYQGLGCHHTEEHRQRIDRGVGHGGGVGAARLVGIGEGGGAFLRW